jgi:ubiquinone/menaquinone biosynthesis C-methylase UbiE
MFAALDLGVFDALHATPMTSGQLATHLELDPHALERLCVALTALQLLERNDAGVYNVPKVTARYLVRSSRSYVGDYYRYQCRILSYPDFGRLADLMRAGQPIMGSSWPEIMADPTRAKTFILGQHSASLGGGRLLARLFDYGPYRKLVDLAGGSGAYAIAAVQANPNLTAVVVDFPNVLSITREVVAELGLSDRITTQPGDIIVDDFPAGDLMLISLIFHSYNRQDQMNLLRKVFAKLPAGGCVVIHDFIMHERKDAPLISALYNVTSLEGIPYSASDHYRLFEEAGFTDFTYQEVIPGYTAMVTAKKP